MSLLDKLGRRYGGDATDVFSFERELVWLLSSTNVLEKYLCFTFIAISQFEYLCLFAVLVGFLFVFVLLLVFLFLFFVKIIFKAMEVISQ